LLHQAGGKSKFDCFDSAIDWELSETEDVYDPLRYYLRGGRYNHLLQKYFNHFERRQMMIILFQDFVDNPQKTMRGIFEFLEIDGISIDTRAVFNHTGVSTAKRVTDLFMSPNWIKDSLKGFVPKRIRRHIRLAVRNRFLQKPPLDEKIRQKMISYLFEDVLALQDAIGKDLSDWYK
jgi:hypothetical protein